MPNLSSVLDRFQPSAIAEIFDQAVRLKEAGRTLWDFSTGEPDFDTPEHIRAAAKRAIDAGATRYTAVDGTSALKAAVRRKFRRDNGLDYEEAQIVVGSGAKPLLAAAVQAIVEAGDEVILPTPCWPSHLGMILLAGGTPALVETGIAPGSNRAFKMTADQLAAAITPRTKALILCSPSNPTGAVYAADELRALADVLLEHPNVWILSDDLYEHITFDDVAFTTLAAVEPALAARTLTVNGVSKTFAMTGWRIGFAGGPTIWADAIRKIYSQSSGGACSISQTAAVEALDGPQDFLRDWAATYQRRRDLALAGLAEAPGIACTPPEGAFYLFPSCAGVIGKTTSGGQKITDAGTFARHLLDDWGVVVVPGPGFECGPYLRLSTATDETTLRDGVARIAEACRALK